jgi:peptidoglycan/xylan/chitin deacetylase (PgdA/CDA1 family)
MLHPEPDAFAAVVTVTELAVTVDDLPAHGPLPSGASRLGIVLQMIRALRQHAVPEVYGFTNGALLGADPELDAILTVWRQAGFLLGNHTFSHLDLARVSAVRYLDDIARNEQVLARQRPPGTAKYLRHPYLHDGDTVQKRTAVRQWLARRGYTAVPVTVDFQDWAWNDAYARCHLRRDPAAIARLGDLFVEAATSHLAASVDLSARLFGRPIKHILALHLGAFDALKLHEVLAAYRAAGTRFITLPTALQDPVYRIDPGIGEATFLVRIAKARGVPTPGFSNPPPELATLCR